MSSDPAALIAQAFRDDRTIPWIVREPSVEPIGSTLITVALLLPGVVWLLGALTGDNLFSVQPVTLVISVSSLVFLVLRIICLVAERRSLKRQALRYHLYTAYPEQVKQYVQQNIEDEREQRVQHSKQVLASL